MQWILTIMEVMVEMGGSMHSSSSNSSYFRSHRMKPAKWRTKYDKIKWDELLSSFKKFRRELESYLLQVGASYMIEDSFIEMYTKVGIDYLKSAFSGNYIKFQLPKPMRTVITSLVS